MDLVKKAIDFATKKHEGQVRKYSGTPYIGHCISVMNSVKKFSDNPEVIAAAVLHDTIEDTDTTGTEINNKFGLGVEILVTDLTDKYTKDNYPNLNRKERKYLEACRLKDITMESKLIKYFDIMDNSSSIFKYDPKFARKYLKEKQFILSYALADLVF